MGCKGQGQQEGEALELSMRGHGEQRRRRQPELREAAGRGQQGGILVRHGKSRGGKGGIV